MNPAKIRFELGKVVATSRALELLTLPGVLRLVFPHSGGDWGDLVDEDKELNELAFKCGDRIFSMYQEGLLDKFYVITEADRSYTTALLAEEY